MDNLPEGASKFDRRDLRKCRICRKGVMHKGGIQFYELKLSTVIVNLRAVQQIAGLEMQMGGGVQGAALADIMGSRSDIGVRMPETRSLICNDCMMKMPDLFAFLEDADD